MRLVTQPRFLGLRAHPHHNKQTQIMGAQTDDSTQHVIFLPTTIGDTAELVVSPVCCMRMCENDIPNDIIDVWLCCAYLQLYSLRSQNRGCCMRNSKISSTSEFVYSFYIFSYFEISLWHSDVCCVWFGWQESIRDIR